MIYIAIFGVIVVAFGFCVAVAANRMDQFPHYGGRVKRRRK